MNLNKLWRLSTPDGKLLHTKVLNIFLKDILANYSSIVEIKCLLLIVRYSWGYKREDTCYLGLEDFASEIGARKSHVSEALNRLVKQGKLLRGNKNGAKYKYAINVYLYGMNMKRYQKRNEDSQIGNEDSLFRNGDSLLGNAAEERVPFSGKSATPEKTDFEHKNDPPPKPLYIDSEVSRYINYHRNYDRNLDSIDLIKFKKEVSKGISKDMLLGWFRKVPAEQHGLLRMEFFKKWVNNNPQGGYNAKVWEQAEAEYGKKVTQ